MASKLCLLMVIIISSGCVTVPDTVICRVAGKLADGGDCVHTLKPDTAKLNFDQYLAFLEGAGKEGPAICLSAKDYTKQKTALEKACRELGSKCRYRVDTQGLVQDQELPYSQ